VSTERLPLVRLRVGTRRVLFRGLRVVPDRVVQRVHDRFTTSTGWRRALVRPLASALFYRSMAVREFVVPDGAGERLHAVGSRLERTLYWYGELGYERSEAQLWRALCRQADDVLEIGANIGYYTVVGARAAPQTSYTAVEANPEAATIARRNVELNGLESVRILAQAVVADPAVAEVELALPDQESHSVAPTGSFLSDGAEGRGWVHASRRIRVPATPARPLFAGRDLVKLDIEGAEAMVLGAALPEIARSRPILLVEILPDSARLRALVEGLMDDRYLVFEVGRSLRLLDRAELDGEHRTSRDVLVVPYERVPATVDAVDATGS